MSRHRMHFGTVALRLACGISRSSLIESAAIVFSICNHNEKRFLGKASTRINDRKEWEVLHRHCYPPSLSIAGSTQWQQSLPSLTLPQRFHLHPPLSEPPVPLNQPSTIRRDARQESLRAPEPDGSSPSQVSRSLDPNLDVQDPQREQRCEAVV